MPSSQIERKLATIMFTDIAGYTAQMSKDEAVAISLLNKKESILKPLIAKNKGTYVKSTGDGSLSYFNSAVDATTCGKRFQEAIYDDKDLNVRVGIHLGETIFEGGDVKGDSVNGAARIESMAIAGGVFVSREVFDQLRNKKEFDGISIGLQQLKGLGRLIEIFGLKGDKLNEPNPEDYTQNCCPCCDSKIELPSIAIIPFINKGQKKDDYFSYGISSELISEVSSAKNTRVASKKQIEDAGNLSIDNLAKKLDVRYIVNGELWRMEDMFQLSIELYDSKEKKVIWLDNWEENWDNLPFIKSSLSNGILKVLNSSYLRRNESIIKNSQAYEYYLKGKYKFEKRNNIEDVDVARELLKEAIKIDGSLTKAELLLGWTYFMMADYETAQEIFDSALIKYEKCSDKRGMRMCYSNIGNVYFHKGEYDNALKYHNLANKLAKEIGDESGKILMSIGNIYFRMGNYEKALQNYNSELKFYENISDKLAFDSVKYNVRVLLANIGRVYIYKGNYDVALKYLIRVHKISEEVGNKSWIGQSFSDIGMIYFDKGENEKGLEVLKEALPIQKDTGSSEDILCVAVYLALTYKYKNLNYDIKEIDSLIQKHYNIDFKLNYRLYQLFEDISYLETAYNQVQETADNLEPDVAAKFLNYPIPKAIVEEWEKVK